MTFEEFLIEASLSRVWNHFSSPDTPTAILTAFRGEYDRATNQQRNAELIGKIRAAGYGFFKVDGSYIENQGTPQEKRVKEESLFVVGKAKDNAFVPLLRRWMSEYDQESVLLKPAGQTSAVLLQNTGGTIPIGEFRANRVAEFMTMLRGKRGSFTFEQVEPTSNWLGRWGKSHEGG